MIKQQQFYAPKALMVMLEALTFESRVRVPVGAHAARRNIGSAIRPAQSIAHASKVYLDAHHVTTVKAAGSTPARRSV